jgi:hypothetical protein
MSLDGLKMRKYFLWTVLLCSCTGETIYVDATTAEVEMTIHENQFADVLVGQSAEDVEQNLGKPRKIASQPSGVEVWEYSVWRGQPPSLLRTLIKREIPKMEFCAGRVSILNSRVTAIEIADCKDWQHVERPEVPPSNSSLHRATTRMLILSACTCMPAGRRR